MSLFLAILALVGASHERPEYVIIVKMWEKGRTTSSEEEVRPVFEDLKMWMIDYLRIKPNTGVNS